MVEYHVMLKRHQGASRPDVYIFSDESRAAALCEMHNYCKVNGFSINDNDGRHTIADIVLVEKEPIHGAPVLSVTPYRELFND